MLVPISGGSHRATLSTPRDVEKPRRGEPPGGRSELAPAVVIAAETWHGANVTCVQHFLSKVVVSCDRAHNPRKQGQKTAKEVLEALWVHLFSCLNKHSAAKKTGSRRVQAGWWLAVLQTIFFRDNLHRQCVSPILRNLKNKSWNSREN